MNESFKDIRFLSPPTPRGLRQRKERVEELSRRFSQGKSLWDEHPLSPSDEYDLRRAGYYLDEDRGWTPSSQTDQITISILEGCA